VELRNPEDRELFLSGLRLAMGECVTNECPVSAHPRRCGTFGRRSLHRTRSGRSPLVAGTAHVYQAILAQSLPGLRLTLNQVELMERNNVAARAGNLQQLGVVPTPIAIL
jgi:hypothetical protein